MFYVIECIFVCSETLIQQCYHLSHCYLQPRTGARTGTNIEKALLSNATRHTPHPRRRGGAPPPPPNQKFLFINFLPQTKNSGKLEITKLLSGDIGDIGDIYYFLITYRRLHIVACATKTQKMVFRSGRLMLILFPLLFLLFGYGSCFVSLRFVLPSFYG